MDNQYAPPQAELVLEKQPTGRDFVAVASAFMKVLLLEALLVAAIGTLISYAKVQAVRRMTDTGPVLEIIHLALVLCQITVAGLWLGGGRSPFVARLGVAALVAFASAVLYWWPLYEVLGHWGRPDERSKVFWEMLAVAALVTGAVSAPVFVARLLNLRVSATHFRQPAAPPTQFSIVRILILTAFVAGLIVLAREVILPESDFTGWMALIFGGVAALIGTVAALAVFGRRGVVLWLIASFAVASGVALVILLLSGSFDRADPRSMSTPIGPVLLWFNGMNLLVLLLLLPFRLAGYGFRPPPKRVPVASLAEPAVVIDPLA